MQARRLLVVALAFAAALAVFTATRGGERAAAGPRPAGADVLAEAAGTAAGRHDFRRALRLARRARALAPDALVAYPVLVDSLVELGRYREAERTLQRFVDLRPGIPAYARVSYFRELHGDLRGAAGALRMAIAAAGPAKRGRRLPAEPARLGRAELAAGSAPRVERSPPRWRPCPAMPAAAAGRARIAAASGDLRGAIARWRRLVARHPLPEYAIALGEAELAAGRSAAARARPRARTSAGAPARGERRERRRRARDLRGRPRRPRARRWRWRARRGHRRRACAPRMRSAGR